MVVVSTDPPGAADELVLRMVRPGQARQVVGVYGLAWLGAAALREQLARWGLADEIIRLVPSVDDAEQPTVLLTLTVDGLRHLVWRLGGGVGPPPVRAPDAA